MGGNRDRAEIRHHLEDDRAGTGIKVTGVRIAEKVLICRTLSRDGGEARMVGGESGAFWHHAPGARS